MGDITYVEAVIRSFDLPSNFTVCDCNGRPVFGRVANTGNDRSIFTMTHQAHDMYYGEINGSNEGTELI